MHRTRVLVIGGGLAGIAAACDLAAAGVEVLLCERAGILGGRASSRPDPVTGDAVDVGPHVVLGCCREYLGLLERLGQGGRVPVPDRLEVAVYDASLPGAPRPGRLRAAAGPAPWHLLPALLRYGHLTPGERVLALQAGAAMVRTDRRQVDPAWTFARWLAAQGQPPRVVERLWDLVALPALNASASEASARYGLMVFQEGLAASPTAGCVAVPRAGLSELVEEAVPRYLAARGGRVRTRSAVAGLRRDEGGRVVGVVLAGGESLAADAVVAAVPQEGLARLLGPLASDPFFAPAARLAGRPIVSLSFWYDRMVTPPGFTFGAFLGSPAHWVFATSRLRGRAGPPELVSVSLSAAGRWLEVSAEHLQAIFSRELGRLFPGARTARVIRFVARKHRAATFSVAPGAEACRLPQRTPVPGLYLAGDWTETGWPATLEGAVRSGRRAAAAFLADLRADGLEPGRL